jgi:PAS domain S-box-containing protein
VSWSGPANGGSLLPFVGTAVLFLLVVIALRLAGSLKSSLEDEITARLRISATLATDALTVGLDPSDPGIAGQLEDIRRTTSISDIALYDGSGEFLGGSMTHAQLGAGLPRRIRLGNASARVDPSLREPERDGGGGLTLVVPLAQGAGAVITRVDREGQGSLPAVDFLFNLAKALAGVIVAAGLLILLRWIAGGGDGGRTTRKAAASASDVDVVLGTMKEVMTTLKDSETHYRDRSRVAEADAEHVRRTNELILESIGSGLIAFDGAGRITLCNPAAERILALPARTVRGRRVDDVFEIDDRLRSLAVDIRDFGVAGPREEFERVSAGGDALWLAVSGSVLVDAEGTPRGGLLLVDDLTETRRLQEAMGIKDRLSAVGEMSAGIAHEIKNSLHSLLGYANLLRDDARSEPPLPVQGILTEVRSLENLVKGILEFSRPSRLMRAPVDLNRLVRETVDATAESARGRSVTVSLELDENIPPVAVDFESVKRVFMNCTLNAIEAMGAGGVLTITTRPAELAEALDSVRRARAVRIGFRDTGPGIPEADRQRIFTPFFTTKREGHGLGLALVHKTVSDHGGRVQLHSRERVGTEFVILLPVEERP